MRQRHSWGTWGRRGRLAAGGLWGRRGRGSSGVPPDKVPLMTDPPPGFAGYLPVPFAGRAVVMVLDHAQDDFGHGINQVGGQMSNEKMGVRIAQNDFAGARTGARIQRRRRKSRRALTYDWSPTGWQSVGQGFEPPILHHSRRPILSNTRLRFGLLRFGCPVAAGRLNRGRTPCGCHGRPSGPSTPSHTSSTLHIGPAGEMGDFAPRAVPTRRCWTAGGLFCRLREKAASKA